MSAYPAKQLYVLYSIINANTLCEFLSTSLPIHLAISIESRGLSTNALYYIIQRYRSYAGVLNSLGAV